MLNGSVVEVVVVASVVVVAGAVSETPLEQAAPTSAHVMAIMVNLRGD